MPGPANQGQPDGAAAEPAGGTGPARPAPGPSGIRAVIAALGANLGIAAVKLIAIFQLKAGPAL